MGIEYEEVTTYRKRYYCDDCEEEVEFTGMSNPTVPPMNHHKCTGCGKIYSFVGKIYPTTVYRKV